MSQQKQAGSEPSAVPLVVSVQVLSFEPGLYRVSFMPPSHGGERAEPLAAFPCARIDAAPGARPGRAMIAAQDGWLARPGDAALVQIAQERTPVLLTIYQTAGDTPPAFKVQCLDVSPEVPPPDRFAAPATRPAASVAVVPDAPYRDAAPPDALSPSNVPFDTSQPGTMSVADIPDGTALITGLAHVQGRGDVPVGSDGWIGVPGSGMPVEGFALTLSGPLGLSIEYSGELGPEWSTPWAHDGEFCGSRSLALPILSVLGRLAGPASVDFELHRTVRFLGSGEIGPMPAGASVTAPDGAPLEAFRFVVSPRGSGGISDAPSDTAAQPVRRARRGARRTG